MKNSPILILDFGSQYTQLIGRRIRELSAYCEIHPFDADENILKALKPCGIILSGGPATVTKDFHPRAPDWVFECGLPVLGICYGMQTMAKQLGGEVQNALKREFGYAEVSLHGDSQLFQWMKHEALDVWMSHGDHVTKMPPGFQTICSTHNAPIAGIAHEKMRWYGLQFHPEVTHTKNGLKILQQFVVEICHCATSWKPKEIIADAIHNIRQTVGNEHVLLALSGGVDSSVAALLLHKALGQQLICVFVDTGLLREQEREQVVSMFQNHLGIELIVIDAMSLFLKALTGIVCPEQKRKIIGNLFVDIFEKEAHRFPQVKWLAQGTIYPDVIESAKSGHSDIIKSHHNVAGLPEVMNLKLLEPLQKLFKDEVRLMGSALGLPHEMVHRHPFPGPGLAVRIMGEVKKEYVDILRRADAIFIDELKRAHLYEKVSQAFAVFLPIKSVGVMGDGRRYEYVICLRSVETSDFMTAHWSHLPWDFLAKVSNRIINEVPFISRVTYDISGKPPATIEWE